MKNLSLPLATLLLAAAFTSCKKDDDKSPSKADQLSAKSWQLTASTVTSVDNGTTTTVDAYKQLDACEKDNFMKFNSNKTLDVNEGALRCDPTDPQVQTGTWDLNSDQTKLYLSNAAMAGGLTAQVDLVELSDSKLVLRGTDLSNGTTDTYTLTFAAK
jgi:hypothetical protein